MEKPTVSRLRRPGILAALAVAMAFLGSSPRNTLAADNAADDDLGFFRSVTESIKEHSLRKFSRRDIIAGAYKALASELGPKYSNYFEPELPASDWELAAGIYFVTLQRIAGSAPDNAKEFAMRVLMERSLNGFLKTLDPYSEFIPRSIAPILLEAERHPEYVGIGVDLKRSADGLVCFPLQSENASFEGVRKGDLLITINDTSTRYLTIYEAAHLLRGDVKSSVKIRVRHSDGQEEELSVNRAKIDRAPVTLRRDHPLGNYVRIDRIDAAATLALKAELHSLGQGKPIVLDLRSNPGGKFDQALRIAEIFLPKGTAIADLQTAGGDENSISENPSPYIPKSLTILQDSSTASGAELIIAALSAYRPLRLHTFGKKTFGKGIAQIRVVFGVDGTSGIMVLTNAKMYGPGNEDWDGKGLGAEDDIPAGVE